MPKGRNKCKLEYVELVIFLLLFVYILSKCKAIHSSNNEEIQTFSQSVHDKIVVIDAGHGGADAGKVAGKIYEKDINLQIAKILDTKLKELGYNTVMIREDDEMPKNKQDEMWLRQKRANATDGDIFVSIHQNSSTQSSAKGFQIYFFKKSEKSKELAYSIYESVKENVNQSTKFQPLENSDYYVLRTTKMPAVLVECGFLSNEGERWLLTTPEYQEKMANGIATGIDNYFKTSN